MAHALYTHTLKALCKGRRFKLDQVRHISVTACCNYRANRKFGGRKKYKIPLNWRDADWNPANIPSAWKPENYDQQQLIDYEYEMEKAKYIPGYKPKIAANLKEDYHAEPLYSIDSNYVFTEGLAQALFLTKSVITETGLPKRIDEISSVIEQIEKEKVIQVVQHANLFDVDPRNLDKTNTRRTYKQDNYDIYCKPDRLASTVARELIRLCDMNAAKISAKFFDRINLEGIRTTSLFQRNNVRDEKTLQSTNHANTWTISIDGHADIQVLSKDPLEKFASKDLVKSTENENLNSLYPVLPILDIPFTNNYTLNTTSGLEQSFGFPHLQTMILFNKSNLSASEMHGRMLATVFSSLYSRAVELNNKGFRDLDEPLVAQVIGCSGQMFNFMCFQLNTTNLQNDNGIKNMVWVDDFFAKEATNSLLDDTHSLQHSKLYKECAHTYWYDPQYYHGYNHNVFKKMQSMWMNGIL